MKNKIIKIILIIIITLSNIGIYNSYAGEGDTDQSYIYVTEKVPGANCKLATPEQKAKFSGSYKCEVERGFGAIMHIMGKLIKYFTFITGLLAVLTIVIGGIAYSMGGADDSLKTKSKEFIQKSLMGLIILLLTGSILKIIAPWVYN